MKESSKYSQQILQKDESVFENFDQLDIKKYWTPELSQGTKDAIWQYLSSLQLIGMTITSIPPEMLSMVEGVASKCAEGMQNGDANPMSMLSSMSGLFGMLGAGGLGGDPAPKKSSKKKLKELQ